ncbi:hypothetical protein TNCV_3831561 [Trichonephila clavipes]|nr:hypothetical protein TNCV_3831561 [Trichonephila clavipes]
MVMKSWSVLWSRRIESQWIEHPPYGRGDARKSVTAQSLHVAVGRWLRCRFRHLIVVQKYQVQLLVFHNQELTHDELSEMHEQDIEELGSLDPVQLEDRMNGWE